MHVKKKKGRQGFLHFLQTIIKKITNIFPNRTSFWFLLALVANIFEMRKYNKLLATVFFGDMPQQNACKISRSDNRRFRSTSLKETSLQLIWRSKKAASYPGYKSCPLHRRQVGVWWLHAWTSSWYLVAPCHLSPAVMGFAYMLSSSSFPRMFMQLMYSAFGRDLHLGASAATTIRVRWKSREGTPLSCCFFTSHLNAFKRFSLGCSAWKHLLIDHEKKSREMP